MLLLAEPTAPMGPPIWLRLWRDLFHAAMDREFDAALRDGRLDAAALMRLPREIGPAAWSAIRLVLEEENLIAPDDGPNVIVREFVSFGSELIHFLPGDWDVFFPGIRPGDEPLRSLFSFVDADRLLEKTRPRSANRESYSHEHSAPVVPPRPAVESYANQECARYWAERGNDVRAAIALQRAGDARAFEYLDRLIDRLEPVAELNPDAIGNWRSALAALLPRAAASGWPAERRLLYELQRACLASERPAFAADAIEWMVTFGRRPVKRELPRTKWVEAHRRLLAAHRLAGRIGQREDSAQIAHLVERAAATVGRRARDDLRAAIVQVLDEVDLVPATSAERVSRDKLVEELLDGACDRGFLRIGDLRDAIAQSREIA